MVKDDVKMYLNNNVKLFHRHDFFIENKFEDDYTKSYTPYRTGNAWATSKILNKYKLQ